jgi:hypothetical protein
MPNSFRGGSHKEAKSIGLPIDFWFAVRFLKSKDRSEFSFDK